MCWAHSAYNNDIFHWCQRHHQTPNIRNTTEWWLKMLIPANFLKSVCSASFNNLFFLSKKEAFRGILQHSFTFWWCLNLNISWFVWKLNYSNCFRSLDPQYWLGKSASFKWHFLRTQKRHNLMPPHFFSRTGKFLHFPVVFLFNKHLIRCVWSTKGRMQPTTLTKYSWMFESKMSDAISNLSTAIFEWFQLFFQFHTPTHIRDPWGPKTHTPISLPWMKGEKKRWKWEKCAQNKLLLNRMFAQIYPYCLITDQLRKRIVEMYCERLLWVDSDLDLDHICKVYWKIKWICTDSNAVSIEYITWCWILDKNNKNWNKMLMHVCTRYTVHRTSEEIFMHSINFVVSSKWN